ncbi:lipoprotein [Streptomyces sp. NPDC058576]|uniref:lipoprotein n=1 Tax=Streptomyces sp. NPDC058576 TaxID=3346547 RepID=UPI0036524BAD
MTRGTGRRGSRVPVALAATAAVAAMTLAGCSSPAGAGGDDEGPAGPAPAGSTPAKAAEKVGKGKGEADADKAAAAGVAARGGRLGGAGSACELPVTFDLAAGWKPKAVDVDPDSVLAELAEQGTVTMVCEIDAKPTGNIGFLRVWRGAPADKDDPRAVLKAFVADDPQAGKATYTQVRAGALAAAEVGYTGHSELLDESKKERAFAVSTPGGPVVLHLGGMDTEEHTAMLPAFELAKKSLKLR